MRVQKIPGSGRMKGQIGVTLDATIDQDRSDFPGVGNRGGLGFRCLTFSFGIFTRGKSEKRKEKKKVSHALELRQLP